jgi:hypothetical protein
LPSSRASCPAKHEPEPAKWRFEREQRGAQLCEATEDACKKLRDLNTEIAKSPCNRVEPPEIQVLKLQSAPRFKVANFPAPFLANRQKLTAISSATLRAKARACDTTEDHGIANLIVWPGILERFHRAALGATLLRCTGKLQREESATHVVAKRLDDLTPRLRTLRDRTGDVDAGCQPKSPFASAAKPPGYDRREMVIASRNFR